MAFLYLHTNYVGDPRVSEITDKEFRAHIRIAAWLARWNLGDLIDQHVPRNIGGLRRPNVDHLIECGVWTRDEEGNVRVADFDGQRLRREWDVGGSGRPSTHVHFEDLVERGGWICGICARPIEGDRSAQAVHVDHIIPRSRGGSDEVGNLQLAHASCNLWKGSRLEDELDFREAGW